MPPDLRNSRGVRPTLSGASSLHFGSNVYLTRAIYGTGKHVFDAKIFSERWGAPLTRNCRNISAVCFAVFWLYTWPHGVVRRIAHFFSHNYKFSFWVTMDKSSSKDAY